MYLSQLVTSWDAKNSNLSMGKLLVGGGIFQKFLIEK